MKNIFLPFILLLTFVFSCRENDNEEILEKKNQSYDVYVSGVNNGNLCYWKNTVQHTLNYTSMQPENPSKIIVDNNNVYVKGRYGFWKNGNYTTYRQLAGIPNQATIDIFDFFVKNDDIYFVGYTWTTISSSTPAEFCYWKNNVKNLLFTDLGTYNDMCTITVLNSDVYVGAIKSINGLLVGGYFKNNNFFPLANAQTSPQITNVVSKDGNIYFSSESFFKNLQTNVETTFTPLNNPNIGYILYPSCLDGNNLYINCKYDSYYKNATLINNINSSLNIIEDLNVTDQNIYMIRTNVNNFEYKLYINNIEAQTIQNNNFNSSFNNITVVKL